MTIVARHVASATRFSPKTKAGFVIEIDHETENNSDFRRVLYTGQNLQLVLMCIPPGEDIGAVTLEDHDQFFHIENGKGEVWIDGHRSRIQSDDAVVVPAGVEHNVVNTENRPMKLYKLYAPAQHREGTEQSIRPEAADTDI